MKVLRPEAEACLKSHRPGKHGITDLIDDMIIAGFNITDDEFDFICEHASDEELSQFTIGENASFTEKRKALEVRNTYLNLFNSQES